MEALQVVVNTLVKDYDFAVLFLEPNKAVLEDEMIEATLEISGHISD